MASTAPNGNGIIAGINVTPLVDIMLVLLVIFMVTAKIMATPAIPLDLPRAQQTQDLQTVVSIVIPASGSTMVNGQPATTDETLAERVRTALAHAPDVRVVINADGAVSHRRVIHVLDVVKSAGVVRIAFGALPAEDRAR
jgi:biopolymer transport protein TolR